MNRNVLMIGMLAAILGTGAYAQEAPQGMNQQPQSQPSAGGSAGGFSDDGGSLRMGAPMTSPEQGKDIYGNPVGADAQKEPSEEMPPQPRDSTTGTPPREQSPE